MILKSLKLIFLFFLCVVSAQKNAIKINAKFAKDIFLDDYKNIYIYKNEDLSFTKYDSLGNQKGKLRFTLPQKIQSVHNPLNIVSFSENAQELKFFDQNLTEIQSVKLNQKFGFIKAAFAEDLQYVWLLDETKKSLVQYNFREQKVVNSFPMSIDFDGVVDFMVFGDKIYILKSKSFSEYNFYSEKIYSAEIDSGKRMNRENEKIYVIERSSVSEFSQNKSLELIFSKENCTVVDKNSVQILALIEDKLYLYEIEK